MTRLAFAIAMLATPALACDYERNEVIGLIEKAGKTRISAAITHGGLLMEMFANRATGTWSVVLTDENKCSTIASYGERFTESVAEGPL